MKTVVLQRLKVKDYKKLIKNSETNFKSLLNKKADLQSEFLEKLIFSGYKSNAK